MLPHASAPDLILAAFVAVMGIGLPLLAEWNPRRRRNRDDDDAGPRPLAALEA